MNDELRFHPLADLFPLMEGTEFEELVADIKAHGLREDIVLYDGMILDGRNRYRACLAADIPVATYMADKFITDHIDAVAYVISANIRRRHLKPKQKHELITKLIKAQPEKSNRQIAKTVGVSHPHVAKVRGDLEKSGDVETVTTSIDTKGRKQPAKKKATPAEPQPMTPEDGKRTKLERQLDAGAFNRLRDEQARNEDLTEKLRAAEIKIHALEDEVEHLKAENAELRRQLSAAPTAEIDDGIPEFLRRVPKAAASACR